MKNVKIYNQDGQELGEKELNQLIFDVEINEGLIHQAVVAQQANKRTAIAHTKTRGEIRGGGKKPWRQKGTGRARQGSIRSPLWRGGGIVFGPRNDKNFEQKINKKAKKKALFMTLSDKVISDSLILLDKFEMPEIKTKKMKEILNKLPTKGHKTLIILATKDNNIIKSTDNLPCVKTILADSLNVIDVMNHKYLLVTLDGIKKIEETYLKK